MPISRRDQCSRKRKVQEEKSGWGLLNLKGISYFLGLFVKNECGDRRKNAQIYLRRRKKLCHNHNSF